MRGRKGGGTISPFALSLGGRRVLSESRARYSERDEFGGGGARRGAGLVAIAAELWVVVRLARLDLGGGESGERGT